ncbi:MAG: GAF and ANTAR domain-containing protein [Acidimicrobiales bacterium]
MNAEEAQRFLRALAADMADGPRTLATVCRSAAKLLSLSGVAVVLIGADGSPSVACAHGVPVTVQDLELMVGEGPAGDAFTYGRPVLLSSLAEAADRWPEFARAGTAQGVEALYALPLQFGAARFGVLVLYQDRPELLEGDDYAAAILLADAVADLVLDLQAGASADTLAWALEVDDRRAVIHQATGMIAVQLDTPVAEALIRLRAHAFAADRPIDEVATDVVARRLRFERD